MHARHPEVTRSAKRRVYLAGPLFTDAEQQFNLKLKERLKAADYEVFLPQDEVPQGVRESGDLARIFQADLKGLQEADVVVAVCDGIPMDDGTAWEIGYAWGRGVPIIGLRTDSRKVGTHEDINLMIQQSLQALVYKVDDVLQELSKLQPSS